MTPLVPDSRTPTPAESVIAELDLEVARASLINCLIMANVRLLQEHPEAQTSLALYRVEDLSLLFGLGNSMGPVRVYRFKLVNPDGTNCHLVRFTRDDVPVPMELDEFDNIVVQALSESLTHTVCETYEVMVRPPCKPTHQGVATIQ